MESNPPYPIGPGQRTLAAIVFTDVVSFSRRMHEQEVATLKLLEEDFAVMRRLCERHAGTELKSTGDGLLLYFTSAVQALGCALQIQRQFAARERDNPEADNLAHRIGIHLGDVFVNDHDVMGDGVNIAARLQGEAEVGGICISQTVYDVVKNKLELDVVRMPPRELKNIATMVPTYRVLLEPPASRVPMAPMPMPKASLPPVRPARANRGLLIVGVLVGAAVIGVLAWRAQQQHEEELARSRQAHQELDALVARKQENAAAAAAPKIDSTPPAERIAALLDWVGPRLGQYTRAKPLQLERLGGVFSVDAKLFTEGAGRLYLAEGGAIRLREFATLRPEQQGAVILSLLRDAPHPLAAGLLENAAVFAREKNLPALGDALRQFDGGETK